MGEKARKIIICKGCNKKLNLDELIELGYIEKMGHTKTMYCPYCDYQDILN